MNSVLRGPAQPPWPGAPRQRTRATHRDVRKTDSSAQVLALFGGSSTFRHSPASSGYSTRGRICCSPVTYSCGKRIVSQLYPIMVRRIGRREARFAGPGRRVFVGTPGKAERGTANCPEGCTSRSRRRQNRNTVESVTLAKALVPSERVTPSERVVSAIISNRLIRTLARYNMRRVAKMSRAPTSFASNFLD